MSKWVLYFLIGYVLTKSIGFVFNRIKKGRLARFHAERARQRRRTRDNNVRSFVSKNKFPEESRRDKILSYKSLAELRVALDSKEISSEELTLTYIYQAATKGMDMEALGDINFEYALNEARICDQETEQGKSRGPLHGIPISKSSFIAFN